MRASRRETRDSHGQLIPEKITPPESCLASRADACSKRWPASRSATRPSPLTGRTGKNDLAVTSRGAARGASPGTILRADWNSPFFSDTSSPASPRRGPGSPASSPGVWLARRLDDVPLLVEYFVYELLEWPSRSCSSRRPAPRHYADGWCPSSQAPALLPRAGTSCSYWGGACQRRRLAYSLKHTLA